MPYRNYSELADELYGTCLISDPWLEGRERFGLEPVFLDSLTYDRMRFAAEAIGRLYEECCRIILQEPHWLDSFFHLTPYQKLMWLGSEGEWHGLARMDMFQLKDGALKICEMNSDTPSGEAEAVILNALFHNDYPNTHNPNAGFELRFTDMVLSLTRESPTVGIVYPTEMPEDLSMIRMYEEWLERRGCRVVLGSPFNLRPHRDGRVALFDTPVDLLLRHYKTDWWGERDAVWQDEEPFADAEPLAEQLRYVLDATMNGRLAVVNPFGSVLTQNKLSMAFFWTHMDLFPEECRTAIRTYIPETYRLIDTNRLTLTRDEWVLKSDYGCEGDEVIIGRAVGNDVWQESLDKAVANRWIVQRYFDADPIRDDTIPNYGIYLIAGQASGIYTRLSSNATDHLAISTATLVTQEQKDVIHPNKGMAWIGKN